MLSAVAARKAATSAQAQILTPDVYVPPLSERSKSAAKSSSKPLSAQKRKSSASIPRSTPRALKKQKAKNEVLHLSETSNGWEDLQADTDAAGGTLMDQETPLVGNETSQPSPAVITFTGHRQWSPSRPAIETSSSDEETDVASAVPVIPLPPAVQTSTEDATVLSTFTPIYGQNTFRPTAAESTVLFGSSFDSSSHTVVIILRPRETLCLLGTYQLNVLKGSVTVDGTPLVPSPVSHHIFAPRSSPLPVVSPRYTDEETLAAEVDHIPVRMGSKTEGGGALLALRELRTGVEALGHIHPRFSGVFRPEPRQHPQSVDGNGLGLVGVTLMRFSSPTVQPFVLMPSWESSICEVLPSNRDDEHSSSGPSVYLVHGAKKTGKSTFARTLLNRLLSRYRQVAFLECDLGQSEFTPAGMVALNVLSHPVFGPAFTHPTVPHSAHYIGATSPRDAPAHYIAAVEACMNVYRLDIARAVDLPEQASMDIHDDRTADLIPLVVNTMGWTKGLGADLNAQIASLVAPTHVFEFAPHTFSDRGGIMDYSLPKTDITGYESTYHLDPVESPLSTYFTPADHRALNVLSYFHAIFPAATDFRSVTAKGWTPASLVTRPPYEVQWHTALPGGLVLSASGAEDVVPEEVALALPGAIIALVALEPGADLDITGHTSSPSNPELNYAQGRPAPSPQTSYCLGLAVLRGLSIPSPDEIAHSRSPSAVAQILTPIPPALFGRVHTAVKGALELPTWGMLDGSIREDGVAGWPRDRVPYLRWVNVQEDAQAHGTDRRRVRRNLMRKGQM